MHEGARRRAAESTEKKEKLLTDVSFLKPCKCVKFRDEEEKNKMSNYMDRVALGIGLCIRAIMR